MGILKDILSVTRDIYVTDTDPEDLFTDDEGRPVSKYRPVSYDSVAKQAKNGTMQFPVLATRSLAYNDMLMISKACERNFASMLQIVFSMNSVTSTDNPQEFVNQYHQNTNNSIRGASDIIGLVFNSTDPNQMAPCVPGARKALLEESIPYSSQFELSSVNEKFVPVNSKKMITMETNAINFDTVTEAKKEKAFNPYQATGDKDMIPKNMFVDSEVKKCNELAPTLMHVRILKDMGEASKFIDFIVGVKAYIHPINSNDMIDHLVSALKDRGKLFRFLQWTTGEISFFKDLMFNIDSIKNDVRDVRGANGNSSWWRALKNIKASRRFHKWTRTGPVLPNATLVVSMEEVDYIKSNHGFDLLEDSVGEKILEEYNLLQLVIVDSSSEIVHFLIDGEHRYNTLTYKGLERQQGEADKQFKEILRAVNKLQ